MPLKKILSKWIFLKIAGWKISGRIPHEIDKYLIVVAPHTSNWDVVIGIFTRAITNLKSNFIGKKELFYFPLGILIRWLGGLPVDRKSNKNFVDGVVDLYNSRQKLVIAVAPEGTRSKTTRLRSGFYYIAQKADIHVLPVGLDFGSKTVIILPPRKVADTFEEEQATLMTFYATCKGKNPENDLRK